MLCGLLYKRNMSLWCFGFWLCFAYDIKIFIFACATIQTSLRLSSLAHPYTEYVVMALWLLVMLRNGWLFAFLCVYRLPKRALQFFCFALIILTQYEMCWLRLCWLLCILRKRIHNMRCVVYCINVSCRKCVLCPAFG